jgi:hypothetical protein
MPWYEVVFWCLAPIGILIGTAGLFWMAAQSGLREADKHIAEIERSIRKARRARDAGRGPGGGGDGSERWWADRSA